jgi:FkbM family methyltransferase
MIGRLLSADVRLALARGLRVIPPSTRGKMRAARAILGSARDARDVVVQDRWGHRFLIPQVGSPIGLDLLVNGVYEPLELELALRLLQPGSTFVDVGANIGCYSIALAAAIRPGGRVLAIEASPRLQPYLERNIVMNGLHTIEIVALAAGEREGTTAFHEAPSHSFGMGSIAPQFNSRPLQLPMSTLDRILQERAVERVDLMKVDVEGFELGVFRGARRALTGAHPPAVLFEFLDWAEERAGLRVGAAQESLLDWGYRLWTSSGFVRGAPPLDAPMRSGGAMLLALPERLSRQPNDDPRRS